jgi:glycosyltransferase involved in cell wall biosynthesis
MKLLQIVWNFPDTVMHPFDMYYFYWPAREAVLRGWEAEVLTFQVDNRQPAEEIIDGIRVLRCPAGTHKGRPFSWPFIHALLTTDADIIHCHGYGEGRSELAILFALLRRRKVIFTPHFTIYPYRRPIRELYDKTLGRFFFNLSDRVIIFTKYTYQHLLALGVRQERLCIVPHVARPEIFPSKTNEKEAGRLLCEAGVTGNPLILGVGRLNKHKGWEYTVRCMPSIVARFPEAKLLILGPLIPGEPTFPQHLIELAKDLGVEDHIQILLDNPPQSHNSAELIEDAYRSATILTHPSLVESFGMVLVEAMAAGIPVVAHNGTGIPCIVDDGVTGYVVNVRDMQKYTDALLTVLSDPALRQRMGVAGRRQAETRFGQTEIASQLFAIYAEVLSSTTGNATTPTSEPLDKQETSVYGE